VIAIACVVECGWRTLWNDFIGNTIATVTGPKIFGLQTSIICANVSAIRITIDSLALIIYTSIILLASGAVASAISGVAPCTRPSMSWDTGTNSTISTRIRIAEIRYSGAIGSFEPEQTTAIV